MQIGMPCKVKASLRCCFKRKFPTIKWIIYLPNDNLEYSCSLIVWSQNLQLGFYASSMYGQRQIALKYDIMFSAPVKKGKQGYFRYNFPY